MIIVDDVARQHIDNQDVFLLGLIVPITEEDSYVPITGTHGNWCIEAWGNGEEMVVVTQVPILGEVPDIRLICETPIPDFNHCEFIIV